MQSELSFRTNTLRATPLLSSGTSTGIDRQPDNLHGYDFDDRMDGKIIA
jgi:hypothetical protein